MAAWGVIGGGATTVAPAAVAPAPGNNPLRGIREYYTEADDLHFTKGKHSISAGGGITQTVIGRSSHSA